MPSNEHRTGWECALLRQDDEHVELEPPKDDGVSYKLEDCSPRTGQVQIGGLCQDTHANAFADVFAKDSEQS
eukprot:5781275-Amphidinium_carterae.1